MDAEYTGLFFQLANMEFIYWSVCSPSRREGNKQDVFDKYCLKILFKLICNYSYIFRSLFMGLWNLTPILLYSILVLFLKHHIGKKTINNMLLICFNFLKIMFLRLRQSPKSITLDNKNHALLPVQIEGKINLG